MSFIAQSALDPEIKKRLCIYVHVDYFISSEQKQYPHLLFILFLAFELSSVDRSVFLRQLFYSTQHTEL